MIRTQVSFDAETYRAAQREAKRQGISLAEFCRRAISRMLMSDGRAEKPWMKYAGKLRSGDANASTSVDEVVHGRSRP